MVLGPGQRTHYWLYLIKDTPAEEQSDSIARDKTAE